MMRRLIRRVVHEQDGIALVMAIAAMSVLAITTTGVIVAGTANQSTAWVSTKARSAFATAQQALAYGEGMVYADAAAGTEPPTDVQNLPTQPNGATGTWVVSTDDDVTWHVVATGTLRGVTRTVSAYVTPAQTVTTEQYAIWNYLYQDLDNGTCISGGAVINMPILAGGDFCATGSGTKLLNNVEVAGNFKTTGNAQVGSATSPINRLEIGGTCAVNAGAKPPGTNPCDGAHNLAYATTVGITLDTTTGMPTVDFDAAYAAQAALTQTGCPAGLFDGNTTRNNSVVNVATIMFGNTDYDCFLGTYEIKWNHTTNVLTANGVFFFDGTLTSPSPGRNIVYNGLASFYFTGGVHWSTGSLCGISGCTTGWDTLHNVLFVVTDCQGGSNTGSDATHSCVAITAQNTTVQFGVYDSMNYWLSGNAGNMAPVMCQKLFISGGTDMIVPLQAFPPGVPVPTTSVAYSGAPPTGWSG